MMTDITKKEIIEELERIAEAFRKIAEDAGNTDMRPELRLELMSGDIKAHAQRLLFLRDRIDYAGKTTKRTKAAHNATRTREKRAREKVQNAINLLKMEGKEVTAYAVAKTAGISYNTARKYLNSLNELNQN